MTYVRKSICALYLALLVSQLAGCGTIDGIPERPFRGVEKAIQIGDTTRSKVGDLLGRPDDQDPEGRWQVFRAETDGIRFALIVPFTKSRMWSHYLFVIYDEEDRVSALGRGMGQTRLVNRAEGRTPVLYAGEYGYHTGTRRVFPSIDGGGAADSKWADYLGNTLHEAVHHSFGGYADALRSLCEAAKLGHPCAYAEFGDLYWGGQAPRYYFKAAQMQNCSSRIFGMRVPSRETDKVEACVWYSMANGRALPPGCRKLLSAAEIARVERLVADWEPTRCERGLAL